MKPRNSGRIRGPFVPVLKDTLKDKAWRALSHGARSLFVALHCRYNYKTENPVYLSTRKAAEELGSHKDRATRWFRELEFYGFIRMVSPGHLGVEGKGKAPHWRLTDVPHAGQPASEDFKHWDGTPYHEQKSPKHYVSKKQNPVPKNGDTPSLKAGTPPSLKAGTPTDLTVPKSGDISDAMPVPKIRDITSLPLPALEDRNSCAARDEYNGIPEFLRRGGAA